MSVWVFILLSTVGTGLCIGAIGAYLFYWKPQTRQLHMNPWGMPHARILCPLHDTGTSSVYYSFLEEDNDIYKSTNGDIEKS